MTINYTSEDILPDDIEDSFSSRLDTTLETITKSPKGYLPSRIEAIGGAVSGTLKGLIAGGLTLQNAIKLVASNPIAYPIKGINPQELAKLTEDDLKNIETWLSKNAPSEFTSDEAKTGETLIGLPFSYPLEKAQEALGKDTESAAALGNLVNIMGLAGVAAAFPKKPGIKGNQPIVDIPPPTEVPKTSGTISPVAEAPTAPQIPSTLHVQQQLDLQGGGGTPDLFSQPWEVRPPDAGSNNIILSGDRSAVERAAMFPPPETPGLRPNGPQYELPFGNTQLEMFGPKALETGLVEQARIPESARTFAEGDALPAEAGIGEGPQLNSFETARILLDRAVAEQEVSKAFGTEVGDPRFDSMYSRLQVEKQNLPPDVVRKRGNLYNDASLPPEVTRKRSNPNFDKSPILTESSFSNPKAQGPIKFRKNKYESGHINPEVLLPDWILRIADRLHEMWTTRSDNLGRAILNNYKGTFNPDEIARLQETKPTVWLLKPNLYWRLASLQEEGASSLKATRYDTISKALDTETGLSTIPKIVVDKDPVTGSWQIVDHDGRHRADILSSKGVQQMPIEVIDATGGLFKAENPATLKTQQGETVRTPDSLFRDGILGGVGHPQGGAINFFAKNQVTTQSPEKGTKRTRILFGLDDRSIHQFTKEVPPPTEDIRSQFGFATAQFDTLSELLRNPKHAGWELLNFISAKIAKSISNEHYLNMQYEKLTRDFYNYYVGKDFGDVNIPLWRHDISIRKQMEGGYMPGGKTTWFNGTDYSPTVQQMIDAGMSPESAKQWVSRDKMTESLWPLIQNIALQKGILLTAKDRVPGYLDRFYIGPYKLDIIGPNGGHLATYGYYNRASREAALAEATKQLQGKAKIERRDPEGQPNLESILKDLFITKKRLQKVDSPLTNLIEAIFENTATGIIRPVLERNGPGKQGDMLSRSLRDFAPADPFGLKDKSQLKEVINFSRKYQETVIGMHERLDLLNGYIFPLIEKGYFDKANISEFALSKIAHYMGISDSTFSKFEKGTSNLLTTFGQDPTLANKISQHLYSGLAKFALIGNANFYITNTMAFAMTPAWLNVVKLRGKAMGEATGNISKAVQDTFPYINWKTMKFNLDPKDPVIKYALEHGHLDPKFLDALDPGIHKDVFAYYGETKSRLMSFLISYNYYKQIMPHEKALETAGRNSEIIGVGYSTRFGAPDAFIRLGGNFFKPLYMFGTFASQYLSLTMSPWQPLIGKTINTFKDTGIKSGVQKLPSTYDRKLMLEAIKGFSGIAATGILLWGARGAPFANTYDSLIIALNNLFNEDFKTTKEIAREMGAGGFGEFGVISSILGQDVSSSAGGAGIYIPIQYLADSIKVIGNGLILGGKWLTGGAVSAQDVWDAGRRISNPAIRSIVEHSAKADGWKIAGKAFVETLKGNPQGKSEDYYPLRDITENSGHYRTNIGSVLNTVAGLRSLDESAFHTTTQIYSRMKANEAKNVEQIIRVLKSRHKEMDEAEKKKWFDRLRELNTDPIQTLDVILNNEFIKHLTTDQRMALGISNIKSQKDYERKKELESKQPTGFITN